MEITYRLNETHKTNDYEAPKEIENTEMKNMPAVVRCIICGVIGCVMKL